MQEHLFAQKKGRKLVIVLPRVKPTYMVAQIGLLTKSTIANGTLERPRTVVDVPEGGEGH